MIQSETDYVLAVLKHHTQRLLGGENTLELDVTLAFTISLARKSGASPDQIRQALKLPTISQRPVYYRN